jgi:hypothetical protein
MASIANSFRKNRLTPKPLVQEYPKSFAYAARLLSFLTVGFEVLPYNCFEFLPEEVSCLSNAVQPPHFSRIHDVQSNANDDANDRHTCKEELDHLQDGESRLISRPLKA